MARKYRARRRGSIDPSAGTPRYQVRGYKESFMVCGQRLVEKEVLPQQRRQ